MEQYGKKQRKENQSRPKSTVHMVIPLGKEFIVGEMHEMKHELNKQIDKKRRL